MIGNIMQQRKNICFYILNMIICCAIFTACGDRDAVSMSGVKQDEAIYGQISGEHEGFQRLSETYSCSVQELNSYLFHYETDCSYAAADIVVNGFSVEASYDSEWNPIFSYTGDAEVTWRFYNSLEEMEQELCVREENRAEEETDNTAEDESVRLLYYTFLMPEDVHLLDIYQTLEERYGTQEQPIWVLSSDSGRLITFTQHKIMEDGYTAYRSADNLLIKGKSAYGLIPESKPDTCSDEELNLLLWEYLRCFGEDADTGWRLQEENLYWNDHKERITVMEEPDRNFVEVRGIDTSWEDITGEEGIEGYFGILKEADYEVPLIEGGPELAVHFALDEESLEDGYRYYLRNGYCRADDYYMTVTDRETGRVLQEDTISLSVELPDTVTYTDLNDDGYTDMRIDYPSHANGERAKMESWSTRSYMLWNPQEEQFEFKTEEEVRNSRLANQNGLTEEEQNEKNKREKPDIFAPLTQLPEGADPDDYIELTGEGSTEYVVQPGDCLWNISERFLGSGLYWTMLQREENAPEDPDYLLPGETVLIPEKIYIRKDPYSRGGLRSEGSFQIEMPDGFEYYFLDEGVLFNRWLDENAINCLPITNEMGENALSEDWEAFRKEVIRCSEEICPGRVSNLRFEKYAVKGGCDLYGYSFDYDAGDEVIEYTHFIRLGAANMTEVIGVRKKEPNAVLLNTTRYIAASFIDYGGEPTMGWGREMGPNVGAADWDYPLLHNLFAAAKREFEYR